MNNPDALKKPKDACNPYVERDPNAEYGGNTNNGEDSEGHSDHEDNAKDEEAMEKAREALLGRSTMRNIEKDLMDLTKASPKQFAAKMKVRFGDDTFDQGFDILNKNKKIVIAGDDSELHDLLKGLEFADDQAMKDFIRFTTTYIIVHGIKM